MSTPLRILKATSVVLIPIIALAVATRTPKVSSADFLSGIVFQFNTPSKKEYKQTLINSYDPDLSWAFGPEKGTAIQPEILGHSGFVADIGTGEILFSKNSNSKNKIASLTKIMTAVVALEHLSPDENIYVSNYAASIGENTLGITAGESYTLKELLYGLVMLSGNDASYAIAEGTAGSVETFVEWMNLKSGELGLTNTHFADPSGLDDSTYSTPEDLAKLTKYALKNPDFREISATVQTELISDTHKYIPLENQTNLLTTYPGVKGVKTGYTEEAGLCLVTYVEHSGRELVGVVLGSNDRKGDMLMMLDHSFGTLGIPVDHPALDF